LLDDENWRGLLRFEDDRGNIPYFLIDRTGTEYTIELPKGHYNVRYQPEAACDGIAPTMPCSGGLVVRDLTLSEDTTFDIDLPTVEVAGTVTLNGQPLPPDTAGRGVLTFVNEAESELSRSIGLGTTEPVTFRKTLLAGHYDIRYRPSGKSCDLATLPCNGGIIAHDVDLTSSRLLTIDIPTAHLSGLVTLDGNGLPDDGASRGAVQIVAHTPGLDAPQAAQADVSDEYTAGYAMTVLPGTYDVIFRGDNQGCMYVDNPTIPCVGGRVHTDVAVQGETRQDVDLHGVTVQGRVTSGGGGLSGGHGRLRFTNLSGDSQQTDYLGIDGVDAVAEYSFRVLAGDYQISYDSIGVYCQPQPQPVRWPCNGGVLEAKLPLVQDVALDFDAPVVNITGQVTLDGAPLPDAPHPRGSVYFVRAGQSFEPTGSTQTQAFGLSGPAEFQITLWPGAYEVWFLGSPDNCEAGDPAPVFPCAGAYVQPLVLTADQAVTVDVPTVLVNGQATLMSGPLTADGGNVLLQPIGPAQNMLSTAVAQLAADGTFTTRLIPGDYSVRGLGALPCSGGTGNCGYYASSECSGDDASGSAQVQVRPAAAPGSLPPFEPTLPTPADDAGTGPSAADLKTTCLGALNHAIECSAGTADESLMTLYRDSYCTDSTALRVASCEDSERLHTAAAECTEQACDSAVNCATLLLVKYAFCLN
jgi:phage baseplate assembly protein gpV